MIGNRQTKALLWLVATVCVPAWATSIWGCSSSNEDPGPGASAGTGNGGVAGGSSSSGSSNGGSAGASSASGGANTAGASTTLTYAPCDSAQLAGSFRIQLAAEYTGVSGSVRDGAVPSDVPEVVSEQGECRLLAQRNLFCDPPCGASQTCGDSGSCIAYPTNQQLGTVTVVGLNAPLTMQPGPTGSYTNPASPALPHPGFDQGASIELHAEGGELGAFSLRGEGVAALEVADTILTASAGEPLALQWQAGSASDAVRVSIKVEFNRHGGTPSWLECTVDDTGSFEIPAAMVDELLALEISGWPTLTFTRRSVDSTDLSVGCVELQVFSQVVRELEVAGVQSCDDDHPCPNDQTCSATLTCPE